MEEERKVKRLCWKQSAYDTFGFWSKIDENCSVNITPGNFSTLFWNIFLLCKAPICTLGIIFWSSHLEIPQVIKPYFVGHISHIQWGFTKDLTSAALIFKGWLFRKFSALKPSKTEPVYPRYKYEFYCLAVSLMDYISLVYSRDQLRQLTCAPQCTVMFNQPNTPSRC